MRAAQGRVSSERTTVARAATFGAVESMMVDVDAIVPGTIDDETGAVTTAEKEGADGYGVLDQIAVRAIGTGANVLGVRKADLPAGLSFAAILRHVM